MKKILIVAITSLTVLSCKKETKTITKTDPKTGKILSVEVPQDSAKSENSTVAETPAIKDSLGVYKQSFKLEKAKTYPLTTYTRNVQTVTDPSGKSMSGTSESTDEMSFTVNDFQNGVYNLSINLLSKRNSESMNGKSVSIDTKQTAPTDPNMKMMWTVNKALVGNKLQMKMKENGEIISITGFEPIYTKVSNSVAGIIKDNQQKIAFLKSFKDSFNEKAIKDQFSKNLMVIPAKGVKIGEKWTESKNASPDGKIKLNITYTLKSVDNGKAVVSINGGIPLKTEKKSQQGVTHSIGSELSQNGSIVLDQNTGWIHNQNINVKTTQTESISDGKQSQSIKSVSTATLMVNPANK